MKHPESHREAIEMTNDLFILVSEIKSASAPDYIEQFNEMLEMIEKIELFISNTQTY